MKIEYWLVVACIALGISVALNFYLYTEDDSESRNLALQIQLDRSNRSLDSIAAENVKLDSLLLLKPDEYTIIKNKYVKIHDTINLRGYSWNDSTGATVGKEYRNTSERYNVNRFPNP